MALMGFLNLQLKYPFKIFRFHIRIKFVYIFIWRKRRRPVSEFNEFKPRLKSPKTQFQLRAGLNLEKLNTIESGSNYIEPRLKFKPRIKFFKCGLRIPCFMIQLLYYNVHTCRLYNFDRLIHKMIYSLIHINLIFQNNELIRSE